MIKKNVILSPTKSGINSAKNLVFVFAFATCYFLLATPYLYAANYTITTVAGGGASFGEGGSATNAQLHSPSGVAVDNNGNIYIVDNSSHCIRKVDTNGIITTVVGTACVSGSTGDGGLAINAELSCPEDVAVDSAGNIYIADRHNHRIRKVTISDGKINTVAGNGNYGYSGDNNFATAAQLNNPTGVAVDSSRNIYIADGDNYCIRKVTTGGIINTIAGNGTKGYSGENVDATTAKLNEFCGVTVDNGNIYIADTNNDRIRKVDINGIITTVAGTGTRDYNGDNISSCTANLYYPHGTYIDIAGNIYIADMGNERIRKVDTNGIITTIAGKGTPGYSGENVDATTAELHTPNSVDMDSSGNIYIADRYNHRIRKLLNNNVSTLTWTNEANYTSDGLHPESGDSTTNFVYRVKYTDIDNIPPASGYPKVHIKKGGIEIKSISMVYETGVSSAGAIYSTSTTLSPGGDYTYYFEAYNVWNVTATGPATAEISSPTVSNISPTLGWTMETNYDSGGIYPLSGATTTDFVYRVKYTDADNDAPASYFPKVHIKKGGNEISGSPFSMCPDDYGDITYSDGKFYTYSPSPSLPPGTDLTYYFEATDINNASATGTPTSPVDAPDVSGAFTQDFSYSDGIVYDGGSNDIGYGVAVDITDGVTSIYVTGFSSNGASDFDYFTVKYDAFGTMIASATYDGGNVDHANGIAVDNSGNVFVTGYSSIAASGYNYFTIKYNNNLVVLTSATYSGSYDDWALGIAVDSSSNVYVTGKSYNGTDDDYFTIKYSSSLAVISSATYNGGKDDCANGIAVDNSGNVYVTGESKNASGNYDYFTRKYNASLSKVLSSVRYDNGHDNSATGIALDDSGYVYVTGRSMNASLQFDYFTIEYDSLLSATVSENRCDVGEDNCALGIASGNGYIYVVGYTKNNYLNYDYRTIKYPWKIASTQPPIQPGVTYFIKGKVVDTAGTAISGVSMNLTGIAAVITTTTTNISGCYEFLNLSPGSWAVKPSKSGYTFEPVSRSTAPLSGDITDWDFVGTVTETPIIVTQPGEIKIIGGKESKGAVNPDKGESVIVDFKGTEVGKFECKIFTLTGELVHSETKENMSQGRFEWIPKNLASGVYVVYIKGPGVSVHKKMVIVR